MYAWQQPYIEAVLETDDDKMPHHLLEAMASIEQRLLSPIEENSEEFRAIQETRICIETLFSERCQSYSRAPIHQSERTQPDHS